MKDRCAVAVLSVAVMLSGCATAGRSSAEQSSLGRRFTGQILIDSAAPGVQAPAPNAPLGSFDTAAAICALVPTSDVRRLVPGGTSTGLSNSLEVQCLTVARSTPGHTLGVSLMKASALAGFDELEAIDRRIPGSRSVREITGVGTRGFEAVNVEGERRHTEIIVIIGPYALDVVLSQRTGDNSSELLRIVEAVCASH